MLIPVCGDNVATAVNSGIRDVREHRHVAKQQLMLKTGTFFRLLWTFGGLL
jgi:hypothetical protein